MYKGFRGGKIRFLEKVGFFMDGYCFMKGEVGLVFVKKKRFIDWKGVFTEKGKKLKGMDCFYRVVLNGGCFCRVWFLQNGLYNF